MVTDKIRIDYGGVSALPPPSSSTPKRIVQKHVGLFNPALYETEVRALLDLPIAAKVETFADTGEIFLKHADRATLLPGVQFDEVDPGAAPRCLTQIQRRRVSLRLQAHSRPVPASMTAGANSVRIAPPPLSKSFLPPEKRARPKRPPPAPFLPTHQNHKRLFDSPLSSGGPGLKVCEGAPNVRGSEL